MIVAVSDLHLGDKASNRSGFIDFIEGYLKPNAEDITHLFLLGDILDLWRRNSEAVILSNHEILDSIRSLGFRVFYLIGNHDFIMAEMISKYPNLMQPTSTNGRSTNIIVSTMHHMTNGDRKFRFIHGHQIDYWYALPFYKAFCKAMCSVDESQNNLASIWERILLFSEDMSPIVSSRISQISDETQRKILEKLAGSLEGSKMSKEESTLVELDLLRQFIEIGQLCPTTSNHDLFDSIRTEVRALSSSFRNFTPIPQSIKELSLAGSDGTPEEIVSHFIMTWSEIYQWFIDSKTNHKKPERNTQFLLHLRRIAAMLTVNLQPDEFLIHGHGHQGGINKRLCVADTGCWLNDQGSFITIDEGVVRISKWP